MKPDGGQYTRWGYVDKRGYLRLMLPYGSVLLFVSGSDLLYVFAVSVVFFFAASQCQIRTRRQAGLLASGRRSRGVRGRGGRGRNRGAQQPSNECISRFLDYNSNARFD